MLRRKNRVGNLTGNEVAGKVKMLSVLSLHQDERDGSGRVTGSPFDGELRAGLDDLIASWSSEDIKTGDLSEDAGGGGKCQKAGLGE